MGWFSNIFVNRTKELKKVADEFPLDFKEDHDAGLFEQLEDFSLFQKGFGKKVYHIMSLIDKETRTHVRIFDYRYKTKSTDSDGNTRTTSHYTTVGLIISDKKFLPAFEIFERGFFRSLGEFFGKKYYEFPDDTEFSKSFTIKAPEPDTIVPFVTQKTRDLLLEYSTYNLCSNAYFTILYDAGQRLKPNYDLYKTFFDRLYEIKEAQEL